MAGELAAEIDHTCSNAVLIDFFFSIGLSKSALPRQSTLSNVFGVWNRVRIAGLRND